MINVHIYIRNFPLLVQCLLKHATIFAFTLTFKDLRQMYVPCLDFLGRTYPLTSLKLIVTLFVEVLGQVYCNADGSICLLAIRVLNLGRDFGECFLNGFLSNAQLNCFQTWP